jgi:hypothetical protein
MYMCSTLHYEEQFVLVRCYKSLTSELSLSQLLRTLDRWQIDHPSISSDEYPCTAEVSSVPVKSCTVTLQESIDL